MIRVIIAVVIAITLTSCWDDECWECTNVMVNGVTSEICYEVDCNDLIN